MGGKVLTYLTHNRIHVNLIPKVNMFPLTVVIWNSMNTIKRY